MNDRSLPPTAWTTGTTEVFKTGTWRASLPRHVSAPSPCHVACPVDGDIAQWIGRARAGDWRGAWEMLVRNNPFPAVAGRVCHHPCEAACNRAGFDAALAICRLERHVGDRALAEGWPLPAPARERGKRVAVVGAGPSGLAAAYHLRRLGRAVTLFEAGTLPGGLLRDGIPAYRLPRRVLDGEIGRLLALGIELRSGEPLDAGGLAGLRARYDAVYLAIGARRQKRLAQLDYGRAWVMDGAQWLALANSGAPPVLGRRMVVVGGGSAAIDVARSARRRGHEVTLLALEREAQLPAQRAEVEEALEEGVRLADGAMLRQAFEDGARGVVLECARVDFVPGDEPGAFRAEPLAGGEFRLEADAVVPAIGQDPELAALDGALRRRGALLEVGAGQATSAPGVYAGGDVASTARFVTEAIGMGKRAAFAIDAALGAGAPVADTRLAGGGTPIERAVPLAAIASFYHAPQPRQAERRRAPAERLAAAVEVQLGFDADAALAESARCFSCGSCVACDNCFQYCPDLAVSRVPGGYEVNRDYCKGCGICVRECPTGAMEMMEELR